MRVVHLHGKFLLSEVEILQLPPVEELQEDEGVEGGRGGEEGAVNTSQNDEDCTGILMTRCACDVEAPAWGTCNRQQEDGEKI